MFLLSLSKALTPIVRAPRRTTFPVALITGANRGIGFAVARDFAHNGVLPVLGARDVGRGIAARDALRGEGCPAEVVELDVTSDWQVEAAIARTLKRFGRIDVLINNAGVFTEGRTHRATAGEGHCGTQMLDLLDVNVVGAYRMIVRVVPAMRQQGYGHIVNISSDMARTASLGPGLEDAGGFAVGYRMSKTALNTLTRVLSIELAACNIKINCISPGLVRTSMGRPDADRTPAEAAREIVAFALREDAPSGVFIRSGAQIEW